MTATNPMLTLVAVPCEQCGCTVETVQRDRVQLQQPAAVCCDVACWLCGSVTVEPFWLGRRPFCCRACAGEWAE